MGKIGPKTEIQPNLEKLQLPLFLPVPLIDDVINPIVEDHVEEVAIEVDFRVPGLQVEERKDDLDGSADRQKKPNDL